MIFRKLVLISILTTTGFANTSEASESVGDFALLDHSGTFHQLSYYGDLAAVVLYSHGAESSAADQALLAELNADETIQVLQINAEELSTRASLAALGDNNPAPILDDDAQLVAKALGLDHVGETLVVDPESQAVTYRGSLAGAEKQLTGAVVKGSGTPGAAIEFGPNQRPSYTRDVVPILKENCVSCHREGGIGPWAMNSHLMVQGFAPMIKEVVMTRRMPPGQIDEHVGQPIDDANGLTVAQRQMLISWVDEGAQKDGDVDPLTQIQVSDSKWSLGEPDLIYTIPAQEIPATGIIDYRYVPVSLGLDEDVWVSAMEFVPGDPEVVHHVIAYVSSPTDKSVRGRETGAAQGESVGGFAPGRGPDKFADNSGRLIRKGSNLLLQMHYTTSGRETVDETQVGIYLHDKPPAFIMAGGVAGERRFLVPPGVKEHKLEGEQKIERDAYLYGMTPHMHFRGKYMRYYAQMPDGSEELLLSVPKYDFNWQFNYNLSEPYFLPAGSKIIARGAMDNSDRNPSNPNPNLPVHFGLQTKHEMFFGFTTLRYVGDTPENLMAKKSEPDQGSAGGQ